MGIQQIILIVLAVVLVGIAIVIGINHFMGQEIQENKDGITLGLMRIANDAHQFKIRPLMMGGGGGAYDNSAGSSGYVIPSSMTTDGYGTYILASVSAKSCVIVGTSSVDGSYSARCAVDDQGNTSLTYSGW